MCIQLNDKLFQNPILRKPKTFSKPHIVISDFSTKVKSSGIIQLNTQSIFFIKGFSTKPKVLVRIL